MLKQNLERLLNRDNYFRPVENISLESLFDTFGKTPVILDGKKTGLLILGMTDDEDIIIVDFYGNEYRLRDVSEEAYSQIVADMRRDGDKLIISLGELGPEEGISVDKIKERLNYLLDPSGYYCPSEDISLHAFLIWSGLAEGERMSKEIHDNICVIYPHFNSTYLSELADCYWYCLVDEVVLLKGMLIITLQDRYPAGLPEDIYLNAPILFEVY